MAPPERCSLSETFFKWVYCPTNSLEIVLALLQGLVTVYTWRVFVISSSVGEASVISITCEGSFFFFPPAKFIVRCVADPFKPSRLAVFLESRLVLDPESNIARTSTKFPFLFMSLTFWTGHKPVTGFNFAFWYTAFPWMLPFDVVEGPWNWLWNGAALGFKFVFVSPVLSLCRDRWWFFLHLSQVEPSGFLQSFVWCARRHLRHRQCCLTISHLWLTVKSWNVGQAARWCLVLQPSGHASSSVSSPLAALFSVFLGPLSRRLSFLSSETKLLLPRERMLASWCNQAMRLLTVSCFPSLFISLPKWELSFGSSLDKSWDIRNGASEDSSTGHPLSSISFT